MSNLLRDLRYTFRRWSARPLLALVALLCGALGIGICTTIFSVFYAMILRPFPFADPDTIVALVGQNLQRGINREDLSVEGYRELLRHDFTSLGEVAGFTQTTLTLSGSGEPERVSAAAVSTNLFPLLRIEPIHGHPFLPADESPGAPGVVLLSHDYWSRTFGGDLGVLDSWVRLDETPYQVIGIMPQGFQYPTRQQLWIPLAPRLESSAPGTRNVEVLARRTSGASLAQVQAEVSVIASSLAERYPKTHSDWRWLPLRLRDLFVSPGMRVMSITMVGAALFVLLIACANVANLLLAQAASRGQEISVRAAVGAAPARIVGQLLTESLVIMLGSGLLGAGLALFGIRAMVSLFPADNPIPYWMAFSLDPAVLGFTAAISMLAGLVAGLAPALNSAKLNLATLLNGSARGMDGGSRLRSALVIAEVALSVVLLIGGALFVRSFFELRNVDPGFEVRGLTTLRLHLPGKEFDEPATRLRQVRDVLRRIRTLPGVESAFASSLIPLAGGGSIDTIEVDGWSRPDGRRQQVFWTGVSPEFFPTLGAAVESGRGFEASEGWEPRSVALVNRSFGDHFFSDGELLNRRFRIDRLDTPQEPRWFTIVGVVPDLKIRSLERKARPAVYLPFAFQANRTNGIVIRGRGENSVPFPEVRNQIRASHPGIPVFDAATMEHVRTRATWQLRLVSRMFVVFGLMALVMAGTGLYGVLAHTVRQQRKEIGIRVAMGASRGVILVFILRRGLRLAGTGLLIGLVAAFLLARLMSSFLFGISSVDPVSFVGLSVFLMVIASLATLIPAWRATQVEANEVLRQS